MCLGTVINGANVTPEVATHRSRHRFGFGSCKLGFSWGTLLSPSSSSVGCCGGFAFTVSLVCNAPFSLATSFFRIFPSFCASCVWFCHLCNRWQIRTKRVWLFLLYVRGASVCVWRVIVVDFYLVFHKAVETVLQLSGLPTSLPLPLYFCLFLSVSLSIYCHYVAHDDIYDYCYKIWIDSLRDRRSRLRRHRQRQRFPWPSEDDFQLETVCECSKNHKNIVRQLNGKPAKGNAAQDQLQDCWQNWVLCALSISLSPCHRKCNAIAYKLLHQRWTLNHVWRKKRALLHGSICKFRKKEQVRCECSTWLDLKLFSLHPE